MGHTTTRRTPLGSAGRTLVAVATSATLALVALAGCTSDDVGNPRQGNSAVELSDIRLTNVDSCDRLVEVARAREHAVAEQRERYERQFDETSGSNSVIVDDSGAPADGTDSTAGGSRAGGSAASSVGPALTPTTNPTGVSTEDAAVGSSKAAPEASGPTVVAGTNNQEHGVDEGDLAKTDGNVLVTLGNDGVLRVIVLDDSPAVDSSLRLDDTGAGDDGVYLQGGQLMLRSAPGGGREVVSVRSTWSPNDGTPIVDIARIDITDPTSPKVVERSKVLGELVATRMIATTGRIVIRPTIAGPAVAPVPVPLPTTTTEPTTTTTAAPAPTTAPPTTAPGPTTTAAPGPTTTAAPATSEPAPKPTSAGASAPGASTATDTAGGSNTNRSSSPADAGSATAGSGKRDAAHGKSIPAAAAVLLPQRLLDDGSTEPIGGCDDVLSQPVAAGIEIGPGVTDKGIVDRGITADMAYPASSGVTVLTVGATLDDLAPVTVEGGAETVYAGTDALYTTATTWSPGPGGAGDSVTAVHRFDLTGDHAARYTGSGLVPGRMLNQYSMSERSGAIRVVTTAQTPAPGSDVSGGDLLAPDRDATDVVASTTTAGRITVLRPGDDATLREVGHLDDLGTGEEVKSVRFIDDRAYVVTFRQTDPLFAVDMSTDSPKLLGELKIPGFSEYLHPLGHDRLLGIGSDADQRTGRVTGFKATLFDVSDPTRPVELDSFTQPGATSSVGQDPHGFTWDPVRSQAIVPVVGDPTGVAGAGDAGDAGDAGIGIQVPAEEPSSSSSPAASPAASPATEPAASPATGPATGPDPAAACRADSGCFVDEAPPASDVLPAEPTTGRSVAIDEPYRSLWSGAWILGVDGDHLVRRATLTHDVGGRTDPIVRSLVVDSTIWTVSERAVGRSVATASTGSAPADTTLIRF